MMLTEAEAKERDCCGPIGADPQFTKMPRCRGSLCMAWRWESLPHYMVAKGRMSDEEVQALIADNSWGGVIEYRDDPKGGELPVPIERRGYCGLAGKP